MNKLLFTLLFLALTVYAQQTSVAVLPSDGTVLNNDELEALTDKMREAALKVLPTNTFVLLKQDVVVKRLGGAENYIKECKESTCIVDLGKKAQVDYVAQASVGKLGDEIRLKVELYDVRTEGLLGIINDESKNIRGLLAIIDEKAPDLFKKMPNTSNVKKTEPPPVVATPVAIPIAPTPPAPVPTPVTPPKPKPTPEPEYLYDENRKKYAPVWAVLNVVPGFGLGSYLQEDEKSASWLLAIDLSGLTLLFLGTAVIKGPGGSPIWILLPCGTRIVGLIAPFYHQYSYNKKLRERLNMDDISLSIDPIIVPKDGTPAVGLAFNVRY
jgi:TolB-like protein